MQGLESYLDKYKNFTTPHVVMARAIVHAAQRVLGITLSERAVEVKNGVAHIATGGTEKSELLLNKDDILAAARERAGENLTDIR